MSQPPDPINSMSTADKLLRLGTFGALAVLVLLVAIRSFSDGPDSQAAPQVAEASEEAVEETTETASDTAMAAADPVEETPVEEAEAPGAADDAEVAEAATADEAEQDVEVAEAAPAEAEPAPEATEMAAADTSDAAPAAEEAVAEAPDAAQEEAPAAEPMAESTLLASANIDAGESAFRQCSACHQYDNERNGGGPHLVGIVGRDIGAVGDWRYSDALMEAEGVWTPERLNEWLINPDEYLPGNRMAYPGVSDEQERINIIGFLAEQAQG